MTDLKLCPFCNGTPELTVGSDWIRIRCTECNITATNYTTDKQVAIGAWNRREAETFILGLLLGTVGTVIVALFLGVAKMMIAN